MQKLDIINELRHIQEVSRTSANVLTSIIRQLEKDKTSQHSDNNDLIKVCPHHHERLVEGSHNYFCPVEKCLYSESKPIIKS